ncbi:hypothetical protein QQS21_001277 [Conoideocrella luteorostrata]|uniref:DUF676 domain-containing protein n=1 Tax=Conoideocrella luteorostrata TaxID=1105319 RepID=A0AAJ0G1Z0_9HYPO|nr:hypothetical protein QQS21_001277 [Conoideocrella luteorostrata]
MISDSVRPNRPTREERLAQVTHGLEEFHGGERNGDTEGLGEIEYDIVAVPGLGADPIQCWAGPKPNTTRPDQRDTLNLNDDNESEPFNWLTSVEGLHDNFPHARIMIFHYSSAWHGDFLVRDGFSRIALGLLASLHDKRGKNMHKTRPIIFIGHGVGGLIIAKAMCLAHDEPNNYPNILTNVTSCIFFGTPLHGADFSQLFVTYNTLHGPDNGNEYDYTALLSYLTTSGPGLEEITAQFKIIAAQMQPKTKLFSFYEALEIDWNDKTKGLLEKQNRPGAVPVYTKAEHVEQFRKNGKGFSETKESAVLDDSPVTEFGLVAFHKDLIQFKSRTDPKFGLVMEKIRPLVEGANQVLLDRQKQAPDGTLESQLKHV